MNLSLLAKTSLFHGNTEEEIASMLGCLGVWCKTYPKGETIFHAGDVISTVGIVLSGCIHIEMDDFWGNKSILNAIEPGQLFAEAYACVPEETLMVNVTAATSTEVLFLDIRKVIATCSSSCVHHARLSRNLLSVMAQKNLHLARRIQHTSPTTIRERLLAYLSFQMLHQRSQRFTIPFNRQQLADYLGVDRSALSNELSKMQKEGLLAVRKNEFTLLTPPLPD